MVRYKYGNLNSQLGEAVNMRNTHLKRLYPGKIFPQFKIIFFCCLNWNTLQEFEADRLRSRTGKYIKKFSDWSFQFSGAGEAKILNVGFWIWLGNSDD